MVVLTAEQKIAEILRARKDFSPVRYESRITQLYKRLLDLALADYTDKDTQR